MATGNGLTFSFSIRTKVKAFKVSFACYLNLSLSAFVLAYEAEPMVTCDKLLLSFRSTATVWINTSLRGRARCCDAMTVAGGAWWRFGIQCPLVKCVPHKDRKTFIWYHRYPENICPNPSINLDFYPKEGRFMYFCKLLWVRNLVSRRDDWTQNQGTKYEVPMVLSGLRSSGV